MQQRCPLLAETAAAIGDVQVRNRGTIGGSIAHADPAADWPAAVLAVGAQRKLIHAGGERMVSAADFFVDLPIGYVNAQGAAFLIAFWPAVAFAASRRGHVLGRSLAGGAATCLLAAGLLTQSKGGAIALAVAAAAVTALSPARLRLLVPALGAFALVAVSYGTLTEPFRVRGEGDTLVDAAREAGGRVLVLTVLGTLVAAGYALLDERLALTPRSRRLVGRAAAAALLVAVVAGLAAFAVSVDHPRGWLGDRWDNFKTMPEREEGSSHLVNLGSNRYDFWRVALNEFRDRPLVGHGARSWDPAYLREGRSDETPRRAHSLELDTASEGGLVGLALLGLALVPLLGAVALRARRDLLGAGLFAASVYFLVHASGDWVWTFPAVGFLFFLLAGIGASRDDAWPLRRGASLAFAGLAAAVGLLAFVPVWLSARITTAALEQPGSDPHADLVWARRLDPLSTEPLLAEAELAARPAEAVAPLQRAADQEPESAAVRYQLGVAYLEAAPTARRRARAPGGPRAIAPRRADRRGAASGGASRGAPVGSLAVEAPGKALITGGAGFIGSHLAHDLLERGYEVHVLDDLSTGSVANVAALRDHPRFHLVVESVLSPGVVSELVFKCDAVWHLAAAVGVRLIVEQPGRTLLTNVQSRRRSGCCTWSRRSGSAPDTAPAA